MIFFSSPLNCTLVTFGLGNFTLGVLGLPCGLHGLWIIIKVISAAIYNGLISGQIEGLVTAMTATATYIYIELKLFCPFELIYHFDTFMIISSRLDEFRVSPHVYINWNLLICRAGSAPPPQLPLPLKQSLNQLEPVICLTFNRWLWLNPLRTFI